MNMQNLIELLTEQHRGLEKKLYNIKGLAGDSMPNCGSIARGLVEFRVILAIHLELENSSFYPELLKKFEKSEFELNNTKRFIEEMKLIGRKVEDFLSLYRTGEAISENMANFKKELDEIINTLSLRITSEEDGVFLYWSL